MENIELVDHFSVYKNNLGNFSLEDLDISGELTEEQIIKLSALKNKQFLLMCKKCATIFLEHNKCICKKSKKKLVTCFYCNTPLYYVPNSQSSVYCEKCDILFTIYHLTIISDNKKNAEDSRLIFSTVLTGFIDKSISNFYIAKKKFKTKFIIFIYGNNRDVTNTLNTLKNIISGLQTKSIINFWFAESINKQSNLEEVK